MGLFDSINTEATVGSSGCGLFAKDATPPSGFGIFGPIVAAKQEKPLGEVNFANDFENESQNIIEQEVDPSVKAEKSISESLTMPSPGQSSHRLVLKLSDMCQAYLNKNYLKNLFAKFGEITKVTLKPNTDCAYVSFVDQNNVAKAKKYVLSDEGKAFLPNVKASVTRILPTSQNSYMIKPSPMYTSPVKPLKQPITLPAPVQPLLPSFHPKVNFVSAVKPYVVDSLALQEQRLQELEQRAEAERRLVSFSGSLVGTCSDMCPELERYMRSIRKQISFFEATPESTAHNSPTSAWKLDHHRAVKDYSRSSADQALPLPRELRPVPVLTRTINYLLAAIVDRPEQEEVRSLWKAWYEFLWTRTRAIRKDIVQQRLCTPETARILEIIVRFHIFAAVRLIEEDNQSFDQRINSENLTKCLQTLKEMYLDLRNQVSDESIFLQLCPHEPEFRAYMILMKLNDNNVLNEVQKLTPGVRKSQQVEHAVSVYHALSENNYIRFFRLLKQAPLLSACVMHRYCSQIRGEALVRMSSAFSVGEAQFPITVLTESLAFESNKESMNFCESWGIPISDAGQYVIFSKNSQPIHPPIQTQTRPVNVIEHKRRGENLSTIFNAGQEVDPSWAEPIPCQSSFSFQPMAPPTIPIFVPVQAVPQPELPSMPRISPEFLELFASQFLDSLISMVADQETALVARFQFKSSIVSREIALSLEASTVEFIIRQSLESSLKQRTQCIESACLEISEKLLDSFIMATLQLVASDCMNKGSLSNEIFDSLVKECCHSVAKAELTKHLMDEVYRSNLLTRCLRHWLEKTHEQAHEKRRSEIARNMAGGPSLRKDPLLLTMGRKSRFSRYKRSFLLQPQDDTKPASLPLVPEEVLRKHHKLVLVVNPEFMPSEALTWIAVSLELLALPTKTSLQELTPTDHILCVGRPKMQHLQLLARMTARIACLQFACPKVEPEEMDPRIRCFSFAGPAPQSSWTPELKQALLWLQQDEQHKVETSMKKRKHSNLTLQRFLDETLLRPLEQLRLSWIQRGLFSPSPQFLLHKFALFCQQLQLPSIQKLATILSQSPGVDELQVNMDTTWETAVEAWMRFVKVLVPLDVLKEMITLMEEAKEEFENEYQVTPLGICLPWAELLGVLLYNLVLDIPDEVLTERPQLEDSLDQFLRSELAKDMTEAQLTVEYTIDFCFQASFRRQVKESLENQTPEPRSSLLERLQTLKSKLEKVEVIQSEILSLSNSEF